MFNYAAWVHAQMNKPGISTTTYLKFRAEWENILFHQRVIDADAAKRREQLSLQEHPQ